MKGHYHVTHFPPCLPHWPKGGWSVYRITGDEIAARIKSDSRGEIVHRHGWPGYLGLAETLEGVQAIIAKDMED